ncbi:NUDIX hydrolase [Sinomonas sp. P47F7]|uniref:NUDIX hydrolase n=1 Tax=Sinomonas sp. P47F7 TaxID=3410987 RepID=UPI003BF59F54
MSEDVLHENPWFSVVRQADGDRLWYRVLRPDSSMVIARTRRDVFVMLKGARDTTGTRDFFEFPCGAIEQGESPSEAAIRETLEETGHRIRGLLGLGNFVEAPGISPAVCHVFTASSASVSSPELEDGETWKVELVSYEQLLMYAATGAIVDGGTLAAIAMLQSARKQA